MHIGAGGIIGLVKAMLDRLDDDLAGMHPDADLQIRIVDPLDAVLHGDSGKATAHGVIFVRLRRAEQRHDAVALRLVDDAVIAEHGFVHELEDGLQPLHAEFGITEGVHQSGRVADVRKQYRQTLALSALGGERLEDILPGRLSLPCDGLTQHAAAMPAKPTRWSVEVAAGLACEPESRATRFTVLVSRFVLTTAMQTLHRWSLMPDGCSPMPN